MLQNLWGHFSEGHRLLLIGCGVVIVIGVAILLVDRYFVRVPTKPMDQRLTLIAENLGLTLAPDSADRPLLLEVLGRMPEIAGEVRSIEAVMQRSDARHRLWVFEFKAHSKADNVVTLSPNPVTPLRPQTADLTRLGIVLELPGANLPAWHQQMSASPPTPPWTDTAAAVHGRIDDLWFGFGGPYVAAVARPDRFALVEMMARDTSPEFHPGLLNSALPIDVQRVLDVVNRLQTGAAVLAPVYRVDVDVQLPPTRVLDLRTGFEQIAREQAEASAERQQRYAEERAQMREQSQAEAEQREQARNAATEAARLRREQVAREREAQLAANAERTAEALARIAERAAAAQEKFSKDADKQ